MAEEKQIDDFLKKIEGFKKEHKFDLSADEDLSIAIMNLISLEEHFFFSGAKTGKKYYYDLLLEVREMRKELLKKIVRVKEGENWCISKHLLAASMRLIEVGVKYQANNQKEEAEKLFKKAYNLYSIFWGLNLNLIKSKEAQEITADFLNNKEEKNKLMGQLNDLVKKLIDCCEE